MVKSAPLSAAVTEHRLPVSDARTSSPLVEKLQNEGIKLFQNRKLNQRKNIAPMQLHSVMRMVDPVLTSCGDSVAVLTDTDGLAAIEIAQYRPHWQVTGWVSDIKTFLQLQNKQTPENVIFDKTPKAVSGQTRASDTNVKAILAPAWAHRQFSESHYHVSALVQGIREMLALLPDYGQLILQDFALPDDHEAFVTVDIESDEAAYELIEFSKCARPNAAKSLQGFFVETLASPRDGVKRFHLPYKWAVEFFHRWRLGVACDAPYELTTLSLPQWVSLIEQCGARVSYRSPHFMTQQAAKQFGNVIRFADAQGNALPLPAESFTLVIEKLPSQTPLAVYERRVSDDKAKDILISSLRHQESDETLDVVEIRHHEDDVLPWYFDSEMRLHVLVRTHVPRPVINAVARGTPNLDGRQWAGYLIEPLVIPSTSRNPDADIVADYLARLMPNTKMGIGKATTGVEYYPAPEYLVQRVRGIFVPIKPAQSIAAISLGDEGRIVDVLADDVLRAISSGLIPDGKLEILISRLMVEQGIEPVKSGETNGQNEIKRVVKITKEKREARVPRSVKFGDHMEAFVSDAPTENLRAVRSVFVQEHITEFGRQISDVRERDFIVPASLTTNTAVCIPMMADPMGKFLLSGEPRRLPIPDRLGAKEPLMHLPAFSLPFSVKTLDQARAFLAKQLQCNPDDLFVLGPSFFVHSQISAERVYPFLLNATPTNARWMRWFKPTSRGLRQMIMPPVEKTTAYMEFKVARDLGEWYQGFSPDVSHQMTAKQQPELPFGPSGSASAHLARHPMISPAVD